MASDSLDESAVSQLWPNAMSILILATMSVSLLVIAPWGIDPVFSPVSHFLALWPLTLLAILTYIAKSKLDEGERGTQLADDPQ